MSKLLARAHASMLMAQHRAGQKLASMASGKQKGAVAFEYIIILVLIVAVIVAAFTILGPVIIEKANEIEEFVGGVDVRTGLIPGIIP